MIPPRRFDIFTLTGGSSEGLDAFRFFFKHNLGNAGAYEGDSEDKIVAPPPAALTQLTPRTLDMKGHFDASGLNIAVAFSFL